MAERTGCTCDNIIKGGRYAPGQCIQCWYFWHVPVINAARGGTGVVAIKPVNGNTSNPCLYRDDWGAKVGEATCVEGCKAGRDRLTVRRCTRPEIGECTVDRRGKKADGTTPQCCRDCKLRVAPPASPKPPSKQIAAIPKAAPTPYPLPVKMVMPSEKRPVYLGGILQIWVTRACDRACFACTQGSNLAGKPEFITVDQFRAAVESVRDYFGVVAMFGGNPTIHPQFDQLCTIFREKLPWERRGLWSNHPLGKGRHCAITFNPKHSNLNVHQSREAHDQFSRDWPECRPYLKGLDSDSRHSPPFVAMKDVVPDEQERWKLIGDCDINKNWSAMIGVFRGQLRGWFCEIAGSQSMLHQHDHDYPDTGVPVTPGWWKQDAGAFAHQVRKHCHECGIPLRGHGALANSGPSEQVSQTHHARYQTKRVRPVELVTELLQLGAPLDRATDYLENGAVK